MIVVDCAGPQMMDAFIVAGWHTNARMPPSSFPPARRRRPPTDRRCLYRVGPEPQIASNRPIRRLASHKYYRMGVLRVPPGGLVCATYAKTLRYLCEERRPW